MTGCLLIYNQTDSAYTVVQKEPPQFRLAVEAGQSGSFNGSLFPWCNDTNEVQAKAFRFYRGAEVPANLQFYMYQHHWREDIWWTGSAGSFDAGQFAGAHRAAAAHVFIQPINAPFAVVAYK
jgi:hypothetical protein